MTPFPASLPSPAEPDPASAPPLRWGILGPGVIAADFTAALLKHTQQRVVAVASRSEDRAQVFARRFGTSRAYGSYEQLLADPEIDAIYIATPMSEHYAQTMLCIEAGKHVLVEKSFMRTAAEAVAVQERAAGSGVFVMEAMKTRYVPQMQIIENLLDDGVLGTVDSVSAGFGSVIPFRADNRLFNPALGGGVLLDIGVYPISFAYAVLGPFATVQAAGTLAESGVDDSVSAVLTTGSGGRALVNASWRGLAPVQAAINGSLARIEVGEPFHNAAPLVLVSADGRRLCFDDQRIPGREGLCFQAAAMARYIHAGLVESPVHSLTDSVAVMTLLDEMRHQVGARFGDELPHT